MTLLIHKRVTLPQVQTNDGWSDPVSVRPARCFWERMVGGSVIPSFGSSARTFEGARSGFLAHHSQTLHGTAIYAYIGVVLGVNVGKYGIHGVSGIDFIGVPNHRAVLLRVLHYTTRSTELFSWSWKPKENIPSQQTCKWILRVGRVFGQNRLPRRPCHPRRPCQLDFGKQDRETVQHRENTKVTKQVPGRDELDQMNLAIGVASPKKNRGLWESPTSVLSCSV